MITPEEQIIRVASENYEHGVRDGARLVLDTLESLGAEQDGAEQDRRK